MITSRLRTATATVLWALVAAPVLAACSVNFDAQTDKVYTPARGVNDRDGVVDVLNVVVVSAESGTGAVVATLVNGNQEQDDTLIDVTVDGATAQFAPSAQNATVPAFGSLDLADDAGITASGADIVPGKFVDVTFSFQNAEQVSVHAPVVPNTGDYADIALPVPDTEEDAQ